MVRPETAIRQRAQPLRRPTPAKPPPGPTCRAWQVRRAGSCRPPGKRPPWSSQTRNQPARMPGNAASKPPMPASMAFLLPASQMPMFLVPMFLVPMFLVPALQASMSPRPVFTTEAVPMAGRHGQVNGTFSLPSPQCPSQTARTGRVWRIRNRVSRPVTSSVTIGAKIRAKFHPRVNRDQLRKQARGWRTPGQRNGRGLGSSHPGPGHGRRLNKRPQHRARGRSHGGNDPDRQDRQRPDMSPLSRRGRRRSPLGRRPGGCRRGEGLGPRRGQDRGRNPLSPSRAGPKPGGQPSRKRGRPRCRRRRSQSLRRRLQDCGRGRGSSPQGPRSGPGTGESPPPR